MKLKKTRKDIIESIKEISSKKRNEMFEVNSKVQAVASPSFVNAIIMSAKNKQMVIDRMKDKEKEKKDLEAQTVNRKANETPKTDVMKKMKMVEEFVNASFKGKLTIKENIFAVLTKSRAELKTLIENAKKHEVKYTIGRVNESYEFKYRFEILNESKNTTKGFDTRTWKTLPVGTEVKDNGYSPMSIVKVSNRLLWSAEWSGDTETIDSYIKGQGKDVVSKGEFVVRQLSKQELKELIEEEGIKLTESKDSAELEKQIRWCKSVLSNPNGREAMDAKANYGKDFISQVKQDLAEFENELFEDELEEARGSGKGQKLDKFFKLVGDLHKDKLSKEEIAKLEKAKSEVEKFAPTSEYEKKDKKNLLDQIKRVLEDGKGVVTPIDESVVSKKPLKENALSKSKFKDIIGEHFEYSVDFEFLDLVAQALDRIDFDDLEDLEETIYSSIDNSLIYFSDQWTIAQFYASSPADLDWQDVLEEFSNDIHALLEKITNNAEAE